MNNLLKTAENEGISVEYFPLPLNKSICVQDDDGDFVLMDYSLMGTGSRERVHLAHEIGHSVTGAFYNPYAACDIRAKHEHHADRWAIEELIGEEELNAAVADGHTEIWDLADYFNVTEDFMRKAVCWYKNGNLAVEAYF